MRTLHLTSPHTRGKDVKAFQIALNARLDSHDDPYDEVAVDGEYGNATRHAELKAAWLLGVDGNASRYHMQRVILHPTLRTPSELIASTHNQAVQKKLDAHGAKGILNLCHKLAAENITESPPSSNTGGPGGIIDKMEAECGIHAAPWCGAAFHWVQLHGGGIMLDEAVRYVPSAVGLAHAGMGGFLKWIPAADVLAGVKPPPGCGVCYLEGSTYAHIETLEEYVNASELHTFGGNTSSDPGGSQSNGGGFFHRTDRVMSLPGFVVGGFAVPRGL